MIGGGLAGLSVACYLARAGISVTLFEKASGLGGRATTQNYDEYRFNRGIHALYTGGAASEVLQEQGITYNGHSPKEVFLLRQGKLHIAPYDALTMLRTDVMGVAELQPLRFAFVAKLVIIVTHVQNVRSKLSCRNFPLFSVCARIGLHAKREEQTIMLQQMNYDEARGERQSPPFQSYEQVITILL